MLHAGNTTEVLALFDDQRFKAMLAELMRRSIPWTEFLEMPMPANLSPIVTWEILNKVSAAVAIGPLIQDPEGRNFWYRRTYEITDIANAISEACRTGSRLHRTLTASQGQHFMIQTRVDEACAAAMLDGLVTSEAEVEELLRTRKPPNTPCERLALNAYDLFDHLRDYVDDRFSIELFQDLRERLLEGIDEGQLACGPVRYGPIQSQYPEKVSEAAAREQVQIVCDYLNHEHGDEYDHAIVRACNITYTMSYIRPLGKASCQVGRLITSLYAIKQGLPVLALLPISRTNMDWEEGRIAPPDVPYDPEAIKQRWRLSPYDLTAHHTMTVHLLRWALREMSAYVDNWERRDAEMQWMLRRDPDLNQRQRSILSRALRNPEARFRIAYHRTNHNIAYATARRDLIDLEERGYLMSYLVGKAWEFAPSDSLEEIREQA